ncbi:MAG: hypothetical protein JSU01_07855 [Bacteroidetes bacterium]|nr:hypothetical protein [Bacteroidota bacterium]
MKKLIGALVLLIAVAFVSCKKNIIKPDNTSGSTSQQISTGNSGDSKGTTNATPADDSLNNVKGIIRLQLALDSINCDNILLNFDPNSQPVYTPGKDAPTLMGFGKVSLSSFSSNNIPLAIYTLPLTQKGVKIRLAVNAQSDGLYTLNMKAIQSIPQAYDLWLMDGFKKDSVELRYNKSYAFNIIKADTGSFGVNRFKLVIRTR